MPFSFGKTQNDPAESAASLNHPIKRVYETERLILKVLDTRQAPLVLSFYERNLEEFSKYELLPPTETKTLEFHKSCIEYENEGYNDGKMFRFFMFEKDNPLRIVGTVSYRDIKKVLYHSCEIGYKTDRDFRRMGYTREAITFLNDIITREMGLHRIMATVMPENTASVCLLESLGFEQEGYLKDLMYLNGAWHDHYLYAKLF